MQQFHPSRRLNLILVTPSNITTSKIPNRIPSICAVISSKPTRFKILYENPQANNAKDINRINVVLEIFGLTLLCNRLIVAFPVFNCFLR